MNLNLARPVYVTIAALCTALGAAGLILPLLPTTPFLLLASWAAARGSPRFEAWIYRQRPFAAVLVAWHTERAVPTAAKVLACVLMLCSWLMLWATDRPAWLLALMAVLFAGIGAFLVSRPSPSRG